MNHVYMLDEPRSAILNYALFTLAVVCLLAIGVLTMAGVSYAEEGHGLHPYIVTVGVSLLSVVGYKACSMLCDD